MRKVRKQRQKKGLDAVGPSVPATVSRKEEKSGGKWGALLSVLVSFAAIGTFVLDVPAKLPAFKAATKTAQTPSRVSGSVVDSRGGPVRDVLITAPDLDVTVRTAATGHFDLELKQRGSGMIRLIAQKNCFETRTAYAPAGDSGYSFVLQEAPCVSH